MENETFPITPPPELVSDWRLAPEYRDGYHCDRLQYIATQAAHWGADQELKACCEWVGQFDYDDYSYQERLRAARRCPKPPSLKAQALAALAAADGADHPVVATVITADQHALIRRALESLPD